MHCLRYSQPILALTHHRYKKQDLPIPIKLLPVVPYLPPSVPLPPYRWLIQVIHNSSHMCLLLRYTAVDSSSDALNCIQHFTSFNSIRYMTRHWGTVTVQSDLDVEHHIPSSRAAHNTSQAAYGRSYCYRILLICE